jgi:hypothetical protein
MKTLAMLRNCKVITTYYYWAICTKVSLIKTEFYGRNSNMPCEDSVGSYQHAVGSKCECFCKRNIHRQYNNLHEQTNKQTKQINKTQK